MIANRDPKLEEKLASLWRASQERSVAQAASRGHYGYLDLTKLPIETDALKLVPEAEARAAQLAPFQLKIRQLAIGLFDPELPAAKQIVEELKKKEFQIKIFLISRQSLNHAWEFYKFVPKDVGDISSRVNVSKEQVLALEKQLTSLAAVAEALAKLTGQETALKSVLEVILASALTLDASDVHLEPEIKGVLLRYRLDGVLHDAAIITKELYHLLVSRIKLLSNLRLNITSISQDGRFTINLGDRAIELRISVIPSEYGETIVMRVLDPRAIQLKLPDLGLRPDDLAIIENELKQPNGMILNTGPTGSGKTTTLYAFLRTVANSEIQVITIEDPIEYQLDGIEQTQVDAKAGYTFSNGLQAIMRQDPDVILVGEIRDADTAGIAIQAALTGHLVFSTLHTNSAAGTIPRLLDLGAPSTSIGPALDLAIAQRLVRKLCEKCKEKKPLTAEQKKQFEKFINSLPARVEKKDVKLDAVFTAHEKGCPACRETGYKGRIAIFELFLVGPEIEALITGHAGEGAYFEAARKQGMVTLQEDGILKALAGTTSLAEVEDVTGPLQL